MEVRRAPLGALAADEIAGRVVLANVPAGAHRALLARVVGAPAAVVLSGIRAPEARASSPPGRPSACAPTALGAGWLLLPAAGGRVSRVWRTWSVLVLFALGTSLITPLIPLYQDRLGFSDTVATLFLGCYVQRSCPRC